MKPLSLSGVFTLVLLTTLLSCSGAPAEAFGETTISGSWHAGPSVGSGFNERYVFRLNGTVSYFLSESLEPKTRDAAYGTWELKGDGLDLHFERAVAGGKTESIDETIHLKLGPLTVLDPAESPYRQKMRFNDTEFWYYSYDPDLWPDEIAQAAGLTDTDAITQEMAVSSIQTMLDPLPEEETVAFDGLQERDGRSYYLIHHFAVLKDDESGTSHVATRNWFFVDVKSGQISTLDLVNDELRALQ